VSLVDGCECDGSLVDCPHFNRFPSSIDDYGLCVPVSDQVYDNVVRPTGNLARPATVCPGVAGEISSRIDAPSLVIHNDFAELDNHNCSEFRSRKEL
jgi:hypothetical protein